MNMRKWPLSFPSMLACVSICIGGSTSVAAAEPNATEQQQASVLRVCADPNNLPQSNQRGEGYENRIAEALAGDLGRRVEYTWFPQRQGFVRNTLRLRDPETQQFKCDLIIGVPKGYELTATTQPYLHSTYAMVFPWRKDFEQLRVADDLLKLPADTLASVRIGVFARSPGSDWLLRNGLLERATFYAPQSADPAENPAHTIEQDLIAKKIDLAIVWGPVAGYLVEQHADVPAWNAVPFMPDAKIKFDYEISMGIRFGEKEWKAVLDEWIAAHRGKVDEILAGYRIPRLDANGRMIADFSRDDRARAGSVQKKIPLQIGGP
jgi:quinoprotein dehydrogenase-associated probable ABC transporter substrate-binding protein